MWPHLRHNFFLKMTSLVCTLVVFCFCYFAFLKDDENYKKADGYERIFLIIVGFLGTFVSVLVFSYLATNTHALYNGITGVVVAIIVSFAAGCYTGWGLYHLLSKYHLEKRRGTHQTKFSEYKKPLERVSIEEDFQLSIRKLKKHGMIVRKRVFSKSGRFAGFSVFLNGDLKKLVKTKFDLIDYAKNNVGRQGL